MSNERSGDGKGDGMDATVAKTAGFVVFSGIAVSILKALNSFKNPNFSHNNKIEVKEPPAQLVQQLQSSSGDSISKKAITSVEKNEPKLMPRTVDIVKGDTLWGLSKEYGVSIEAIKEANGLTGDTIYAGKKLIIP